MPPPQSTAKPTAPKPISSPVSSAAAPDAPLALADKLNLDDFERAAEHVFSPKAWAFINGGSNDLITLGLNRSMLNRIMFRPAIFRKVASVSTKTTLFGCDLAIPAFICPMGTTRLAGPEAEIAQTKGAAASGSIQCISTAASFPLDDILEATPKQAWFQLYVNSDRKITEALVRKITNDGRVKALFITVDLPVVSKREADERVKADNKAVTNPALSKGNNSRGVAKSVSSWFDANLSWDDIAWLRGLTHLPIIVKGIQRYEDAKLAMEYGCDGILISNHGGRAVDGAVPSILTLLEIRKKCPEVFSKLKVLVDGGFRRGSDIIKAMCLGASAVGFGRPFMYALQHGQPGVEHVFNSEYFTTEMPSAMANICVSVLRDELETGMRLCGMTDIENDPSPKYINTRDLDYLVDGDELPPLRQKL